MDQRKSKYMTMQEALHPRIDSDRLYVSRKVGRSRIDIVGDYVDASILVTMQYIKKSKIKLISVVSNANGNRIHRTTTEAPKQKR